MSQKSRWAGKKENNGLKNTKKGNNSFKINQKQLGKKAGKHMIDFGLNPSDKLDRDKFLNLILDIEMNYDEVVRGVSWRGQDETVVAYIKGEDIVLTKNNNEFITILRGGIYNERIKDARGR